MLPVLLGSEHKYWNNTQILNLY